MNLALVSFTCPALHSTLGFSSFLLCLVIIIFSFVNKFKIFTEGFCLVVVISAICCSKFLFHISLFTVYADGSICLDILQNQWSPIYDVAAILTSIQVRTSLIVCCHFRTLNVGNVVIVLQEYPVIVGHMLCLY